MWAYENPAGTFYIYYTNRTCYLRLNDKIISINPSRDALAKKVYNFDTGHADFDILAFDPNVQPPEEIKYWKQTTTF